jgi:RHS repeat-associated protein
MGQRRGAWTAIGGSRWVDDGWNRIALLSPSNAVTAEYAWGLDASGSLQGAGGVGGLLATRLVSSSNTDYFPTYDGNGNVSEYLGITGNNVVHYEYDPFGTLTRRTGSTSTRLQYRFSTKPRDFNTGLYYYGYRWYDPVTGRWPSRDPIEESGGVNLYGFNLNGPTNWIDILGAAPGPYQAPNWGMPSSSNSPSPDLKSVVDSIAAQAVEAKLEGCMEVLFPVGPFVGTLQICGAIQPFSCCDKYEVWFDCNEWKFEVALSVGVGKELRKFPHAPKDPNGRVENPFKKGELIKRKKLSGKNMPTRNQVGGGGLVGVSGGVSANENQECPRQVDANQLSSLCLRREQSASG